MVSEIVVGVLVAGFLILFASMTDKD